MSGMVWYKPAPLFTTSPEVVVTKQLSIHSCVDSNPNLWPVMGQPWVVCSSYNIYLELNERQCLTI